MSHEGNDFNIEAKKDEMEEVKNWKDLEATIAAF